MTDELRATTTKMLAKHLAAIDHAGSEYTIEMRQKDAEIDTQIPHRPRACFCTGACQPDRPEYQGACVAIPLYHLAGALQGIIPACRIAVTERMDEVTNIIQEEIRARGGATSQDYSSIFTDEDENITDERMSSFDPRLKCCPECKSTEVHFMDVWQIQNDAPVQFYPVRCADCETRTMSYADEDTAIQVWNNLLRAKSHCDSVQLPKLD